LCDTTALKLSEKLPGLGKNWRWKTKFRPVNPVVARDTVPCCSHGYLHWQNVFLPFRRNVETERRCNFKTQKPFICGVVQCVILRMRVVKMYYNSLWFALLLQIFLVIISTLCWTWWSDKHAHRIIHITIGIFIHSSLCVLKFMLPARSPDFTEAARTTQKAEHACPKYPKTRSPRSPDVTRCELHWKQRQSYILTNLKRQVLKAIALTVIQN